jgi:hypothetical protein
MKNDRLVQLAIKGLEAERARIDEELLVLRKQAGRGSGNNDLTPSGRPRRKMSAAAKKKISEAMKRRYAALRAGSKK